MTPLDPDRLLTPVPGEDPTGTDLRYDDAFLALERAAAGRPRQEMGKEVKEAEPPKWPDVLERAEALLGRTKDLAVAVHLTHAATRLDGISGLEAGLTVIRRYLETWWDGLHPRLDPDDNNDPTERMNKLLPLADPEKVVGALRVAPLVQSRGLGKFSYRDHLEAAGEIPAAGKGARVVEPSHIEAAFQDVGLVELQATAASLQNALEHVQGIEAVIANQIGAPNGPDLERLTSTLGEINKLVTGQLARRGIGEAAGAEGSPAGKSVSSGGINSRDDVVRALSRICDYFERHEPSSPVPLLLRRAQRLVTMDFLEILRDMTPAGVAEAETIGGIRTATTATGNDQPE